MGSQIDARLDAVRQLVTNARSMPMSTSAMVNRGELLGLIDELQQEVEAELSRLRMPQEQADEMLRQARADQQRMVGDTDVYKVAVAQAQEITDTAKRDAEALRLETDQYVEGKLANFELTLDRTLEAVRRGRSRLGGRGEPEVSGAAAQDDVAAIQLPEHLRRRHRA